MSRSDPFTLTALLQSIPDNRTATILRVAFENVPFFLGEMTAAEIAALNASIAAGRVFGAKNASVVRKEDGVLLILQGVGSDAQFVEGAGGLYGGVVVQPIRSGNFTLGPADSGTIIPVLGAVTVTVNAASDLSAPVEIRRNDAATLGVVGSGASIINPATGAAWGTLQVTNKLSSVVVFPGTTADEYRAMKVGA